MANLLYEFQTCVAQRQRFDPEPNDLKSEVMSPILCPWEKHLTQFTDDFPNFAQVEMRPAVWDVPRIGC